MGSDLTRLLSNHPTTPAQARDARVTLAELALKLSDDPAKDLARALAAAGLDGADDA